MLLPLPSPMTLRLMDSAQGIVAHFLLPLTGIYPLQNRIQDDEAPNTIFPIHTINDLPVELLTHILEYFQDDTNSLKSFSLISRPFLSICRKYLFAYLRLNSLGSSFNDQCDTWISILNQSPDLLSSTRNIELGPPVFRLRSRDPIAYSNHWARIIKQRVPSIHDQRIQTIIQYTPHPQSIILRFEFQEWKNFSPTFQSSFIKLIQRETVSSLSLEDVVNFPMRALSRCRHLRELSLISFHICESVSGSGLLEDEVWGGPKGYLESLMLFSSDQCIETLISILSSPQSLLDLTKLQRLSINSTGLDGRFAMKKIPLIARYITTLELRVGGQNVGYDMCSLGNFPNLRSLSLSISFNRYKRPIRDLATFLSKSDRNNGTSSTRSALEKLKILFRHDIPALQLEKSPKDTMQMFQHKDWRILEHNLIHLGLFPGLCKLVLGLRPGDVGTFMNETLKIGLHSFLCKLTPTLYALVNPTIEVFDDRFEQFTE